MKVAASEDGCPSPQSRWTNCDSGVQVEQQLLRDSAATDRRTDSPAQLPRGDAEADSAPPEKSCESRKDSQRHCCSAHCCSTYVEGLVDCLSVCVSIYSAVYLSGCVCLATQRRWNGPSYEDAAQLPNFGSCRCLQDVADGLGGNEGPLRRDGHQDGDVRGISNHEA